MERFVTHGHELPCFSKNALAVELEAIGGVLARAHLAVPAARQVDSVSQLLEDTLPASSPTFAM